MLKTNHASEGELQADTTPSVNHRSCIQNPLVRRNRKVLQSRDHLEYCGFADPFVKGEGESSSTWMGG